MAQVPSGSRTSAPSRGSRGATPYLGRGGAPAAPSQSAPGRPAPPTREGGACALGLRGSPRRGRGRPAALGADATPTRPTSGTLTPATRSRARSSCAPPVSGRGPALVTGGCGPGAGGRGRGLPSSGPELARSEQPPATAAEPRPLPPASKVRERDTDAGSGRSGAEVAPGAGPLPAAAARRSLSAPPLSPAGTPRGRAPRDGLLRPRAAPSPDRGAPVAPVTRSPRRRARGPRTCGREKQRPGLRSGWRRPSAAPGSGSSAAPGAAASGAEVVVAGRRAAPGIALSRAQPREPAPRPSCRRAVGDPSERLVVSPFAFPSFLAARGRSDLLHLWKFSFSSSFSLSLFCFWL